MKDIYLNVCRIKAHAEHFDILLALKNRLTISVKKLLLTRGVGYIALKVFIFKTFLVRIFSHSDRIPILTL